ncbi:lysophospholipid acyltransferase family protein [Capilliphycus salinus ALCB114379]|uniref:lysophospholipid acyltransferase family protein n=1 Tax=Capilliphycus salinus TaxID=2768948 RepID=UPI0039A40658
MMTLDFKESPLKMPTSPKGKLTISPVSPWLTALAYPLGRFLVLPSYFRKIEVIGQENLPKTGPVILAPTHRSRWDALMMPYATGRCVSGRDLRFMVTEDEMKGIQGWFIRRLGGFAVNPRHPSIATLRYGVELLRQGEMMVIFPEGNIFQDNEVHPLKPGLARLALQAESSQANLNVQIVPMSLHYTPIVPRWGCRVRVNIGKPLSVANYCQGSAKQNAKHLIGDLTTVLTELDRC